MGSVRGVGESEMNKQIPVQEAFERGRRLLEQGSPEAALEPLLTAHDQAPDNARLRSYYGLCLGLVERRFEESLDLCQSALKQEFYNPDLYLNVARVHLCFGFKAEGIRYLRRGKLIDPGNQDIQQELLRVGCRRRQVLAFLPRRHLLNRWLGRLTNWIGNGASGRLAA